MNKTATQRARKILTENTFDYAYEKDEDEVRIIADEMNQHAISHLEITREIIRKFRDKQSDMKVKRAYNDCAIVLGDQINALK